MRVLSVEAVAASVAAYRHVIEDLGVDPKKVLVTGESGGGLMALLMLQVRGLAHREVGKPPCSDTVSIININSSRFYSNR